MHLSLRPTLRVRPVYAATRLALATMAGALCSPAYAAETPANTTTLDSVIVTGEKIDRDQKDTTSAVTVFQTPKVDDGQQHNVNDLAQEVPNATRNAAGGINLRGVAGSGPTTGVFTFISGARPRISTTVDGVAETWAGQQYLNVGLWDVEQVEVFRGPQSTIQGRNALGGAMVVKTKDPSFEWEGAARLGGESNNGRGYVAGMISGPLVDNELAFRLSAEKTKGTGFIDYSGAFPWDPSVLGNHTVRGKLLWTPSAMPNLSTKLTLVNRQYKGEFINRIEAPCSSAACDNTNDMFKNYAFYGISANTRRQDSKNNGINLDVDYRFTDSLTGYFLYGHSKDKLHFEESGRDRFYLDQDQSSNTLETRLVYDPKNGGIKGVAGLYYYDRHQDLTAASKNPASVTFAGTDKVQTVAGYGEATIGITERIDLITGARLERERQKRDLAAWPGTSYAGTVATDSGDPMFLPKLGIQYKLPDTTLGLTARKGYNPGGGALDWYTSAYYEYDKETLTTYEATSRSVFMDNRLSINATAFYNQYKGYQALYERRLINIGRGNTYGVELDTAARVSPSLTLYAAIGLLNTRVTDGGLYGSAIEGKQFDSAPHFTGNVGFKQKFGPDWFVSGNVNYVGKYYSNISNNAQEMAGNYVLANLQVGFDKGNYAIRAYVNNLFDQRVLYATNINRGYGNNKMIVGDVGSPRMIGLVLDYRF